jgi:hypothetical protein
MELFEGVSDSRTGTGAPIMGDGQAKDKCDCPTSRYGSMPNEPGRLYSRHTRRVKLVEEALTHEIVGGFFET